MNTDDNGVIVQVDNSFSRWNGGDSVAWEGHRRYLDPGVEFRGIDYVLNFRQGKIGYCRHPYSDIMSVYYKNPWNGNISRDQLTGILAATIGRKDYGEMLRIILHHGAWIWLFAYNTVRNGDKSFAWKLPDLTLFDIWAMEIRGLGPVAWLLWPLLNILDLQMLIATLVFNKYEKDSDIISFAIKSIVQREHCPTLVSRLAWLILDKQKLIILLGKYWSGWRDNSSMTRLYVEKIVNLK